MNKIKSLLILVIILLSIINAEINGFRPDHRVSPRGDTICSLKRLVKCVKPYLNAINEDNVIQKVKERLNCRKNEHY